MSKPFGQAGDVTRRYLKVILAVTVLLAILTRPAWAQQGGCPEVLCPKSPATCEASSFKYCLDEKKVVTCTYSGTQGCTNRAVDSCLSVRTTQVCPGKKVCADGKCCPPKKAKFTPRAVRLGPPAQVDITVHDPVNGIGTITATKLVNATLEITPFVPGTTSPVVATATKLDSTLSSQVEIRACTVDGCCQNGDPVLAVLQVPKDQRRIRETFSKLPLADRFVRIQNGAPGLQRIDILINGLRVKTFRLKRSEIATADIGPYLENIRNLITVVGYGRPGYSALILVSDDASILESSDASDILPHIQWRQTPPEPGQNLSWGGQN